MEGWRELIEGMSRGSTRALARVLTRVENREPGWLDALRELHPRTGRARMIGITGSPGTGKSTLTGQVVGQLADLGFRVGVVAVDPSSPFSGGAVLGDRLRMSEVSTHRNVFIRSMATRGALGGLCRAATQVTRVLDAAGMDFIVIETVGVGQDEVDVMRAADLVLVVCVPGQGDGVQAIKAGIMEIADLFVVNKADRQGADAVAADIRAMLELGGAESTDTARVFLTVATTGEGVIELVAAARGLLDGRARNGARAEQRIRDELAGMLEQEVAALVKDVWGPEELGVAVRDIMDRRRDPYSTVQEMLAPLRVLVEDRLGGNPAATPSRGQA